MAVGKNVKTLRLKRAMTIEELAKLSGLTVATISHIENDIVSPNQKTIKTLAQTFDVSVFEITK